MPCKLILPELMKQVMNIDNNTIWSQQVVNHWQWWKTKIKGSEEVASCSTIHIILRVPYLPPKPLLTVGKTENMWLLLKFIRILGFTCWEHSLSPQAKVLCGKVGGESRSISGAREGSERWKRHCQEWPPSRDLEDLCTCSWPSPGPPGSPRTPPSPPLPPHQQVCQQPEQCPPSHLQGQAKPHRSPLLLLCSHFSRSCHCHFSLDLSILEKVNRLGHAAAI